MEVVAKEAVPLVQKEIDFSNVPMQNFINSIKSKTTKKIYIHHFSKFLNYYNLTVETLQNLPIKEFEQLIINYIEKSKQEDKGHSYLSVAFCSIKHFCVMNDIRINKEKIGKFLGEAQRKNTDRAYTHQEIKRLLDVADLRMKSIVLLMASTGMRIGAIPDLKLKHLEEIPDKQIYKITVYQKAKEEYYTFCSHECYSVIKSYLEYRTKSGEMLNDESYLIREQSDINDFEQIRKKSRGITIEGLKTNLMVLLRKAGIREITHNFQYGDRTAIPMSHGFRKFWMNQAVKSKMNAEAREMLLGHKIGLASAYYRPSEEEMLDAYLVAVDNLTINEENRLRIKVQKYEMDNNTLANLMKKMEVLERTMYQHKLHNTINNISPEETQQLVEDNIK